MNHHFVITIRCRQCNQLSRSQTIHNRCQHLCRTHQKSQRRTQSTRTVLSMTQPIKHTQLQVLQCQSLVQPQPVLVGQLHCGFESIGRCLSTSECCVSATLHHMSKGASGGIRGPRVRQVVLECRSGVAQCIFVSFDLLPHARHVHQQVAAVEIGINVHTLQWIHVYDLLDAR